MSDLDDRLADIERHLTNATEALAAVRTLVAVRSVLPEWAPGAPYADVTVTPRDDGAATVQIAPYAGEGAAASRFVVDILDDGSDPFLLDPGGVATFVLPVRVEWYEAQITAVNSYGQASKKWRVYTDPVAGIS